MSKKTMAKLPIHAVDHHVPAIPNEPTFTHLKALAGELYTDGYMCGNVSLPEEIYMGAWAIVMHQVANGIPYDQDLFGKAVDKLQNQK